MSLKLTVEKQTFELRQTFAISRDKKNAAEVVFVELNDGTHSGKGECCPYTRYGESVDGVISTIKSLEADIANGLDRLTLQTKLPAGAARNALDCAFWDLNAKQNNKPVFQLLNMEKPAACAGAITISLATPSKMFIEAKKYSHFNLIKIKLGGDGDDERLQAVRQAAPDSTLIVDANEGWSAETFDAMIDMLIKYKVAMVEQPLPADCDDSLVELKKTINKYSIIICADESCHDCTSLDSLHGKYDMVNIKLDKTGGLSQALALVAAAKKFGYKIMIGSMVSSSLALAPAFLLAQYASFVDLDSPLLLAVDRKYPIIYKADKIQPPSPQLWG